MKRAVCVLLPLAGAPDVFLAVSRRDDVTQWGLPGGKVDLGEHEIEAAVRELFEEVGLLLQAADMVPLYCSACPGKSADDTYWVTTFLAPALSAADLSRVKPEAGLAVKGQGSQLLCCAQSSPFAGYNQGVFQALSQKLGTPVAAAEADERKSIGFTLADGRADSIVEVFLNEPCAKDTSLYTGLPATPAQSADAEDAACWRWLSEHVDVAWSEIGLTRLVRVVSDKHREALTASVKRMMAGDWSEVRQRQTRADELVSQNSASSEPASAAEVPSQSEAVRIYDYVWRQSSYHADECIYVCSYTPAEPLAAGKLLAVVHPSQIPNSYLQREGETTKTVVGSTALKTPAAKNVEDAEVVRDRLLYMVEQYGDERATKAYHGEFHCRVAPAEWLTRISAAIDDVVGSPKVTE